MRRRTRLRLETYFMESIYDIPLYYDILFGWNRANEALFYDQAFREAGLPEGARVLEIGCGPGQVGRRLARLGWRVAGLDNRPAMVAFFLAEAGKEGLDVDGFCAEMQDGIPGGPFNAALNPLSSFRLLQTDAAAIAHLGAVAEGLSSGGVYVLDLDFLGAPDDAALTTDEAWTMTRDGITVSANDDEITVTGDGAERRLAWGDGPHLRGMTWSAFAELVARSGRHRIEACHLDTGPDAEGISSFDSEPDAAPPIVGRAMVVLRRSS